MAILALVKYGSGFDGTNGQTSGRQNSVGEGNYRQDTRGYTTTELEQSCYWDYTGTSTPVWAIALDNADQDFEPTTGVDDFWQEFGNQVSQYPSILKIYFNGDEVLREPGREFGQC